MSSSAWWCFWRPSWYFSIWSWLRCRTTLWNTQWTPGTKSTCPYSSFRYTTSTREWTTLIRITHRRAPDHRLMMKTTCGWSFWMALSSLWASSRSCSSSEFMTRLDSSYNWCQLWSRIWVYSSFSCLWLSLLSVSCLRLSVPNLVTRTIQVLAAKWSTSFKSSGTLWVI